MKPPAVRGDARRIRLERVGPIEIDGAKLAAQGWQVPLEKMVTGAKEHFFAVGPEADRYRRVAGERAEKCAVGKTDQIEIVVVEDGDHFFIRREPRVITNGFEFRSARQTRELPESGAGPRATGGQQISARAQAHGIVRAGVEAAN